MIEILNKILENHQYRKIEPHEVEFYRWLIEREQPERIAEMSARIAVMSELEEQHLATIDQQAARITELEAQLS